MNIFSESSPPLPSKTQPRITYFDPKAYIYLSLKLCFFAPIYPIWDFRKELPGEYQLRIISKLRL